ncbi:Os08g0307820 [Oryza sativa Japonica Group]|uniref:Os08g0307820 protein n=1 Tax=Oryza sativa subsp. japonica TaxID=39947 RepID=A0A0P0XE64_ORYSJ|nr:Os08g0307820 [Oryza sativa Japonica Group]
MSATRKSSSSSSPRISRGRNSSSPSSSSSLACLNVAYGRRWPSARDFHSPTRFYRGGARGASPGEGGGHQCRPPRRRRGTNGRPGGCGGRRSLRAWCPRATPASSPSSAARSHTSATSSAPSSTPPRALPSSSPTSLPDAARAIHDGLYTAIDVFLKVYLLDNDHDANQ